jgi:hypothetical protein
MQARRRIFLEPVAMEKSITLELLPVIQASPRKLFP